MLQGCFEGFLIVSKGGLTVLMMFQGCFKSDLRSIQVYNILDFQLPLKTPFKSNYCIAAITDTPAVHS